MGSLHQRTFAQAPISGRRQPTTIGDRLFDGAFICRARASRVLATQHTSVDEGIGNTGGICWHVCHLTYVPFSEYNCTRFGILLDPSWPETQKRSVTRRYESLCDDSHPLGIGLHDALETGNTSAGIWPRNQ